MTTSTSAPRARRSANRTAAVWLLGLAGQPAKRIRQAVTGMAETTRFDLRDLPGQAEYDRAEPLAVFMDLASWRMLAPAPPTWLAGARRILVVPEGEETLPEEVLARGFLAVLAQPLGKARIVAALKAAREESGLVSEIFRMLGEAERERDQMDRDRGRWAFFQHMLARAMSTLDLATILAQVLEDLGAIFPVSEVLGVFWGKSAECELFLPGGVSGKAWSARAEYLLDLAARLKGSPPCSYRLHQLPGGEEAAPAEPGRALLVPMRPARLDEAPFGCLCVLIHRDLTKLEQEAARQALNQLAPCLRNGLEFLRLKRLADRDGLTGLYNRRSFDARLERELKRHMRCRDAFSLIMADLDHLKRINDTMGHLAGDAAIKHAAGSMESGLRETDFVARFGGEEFGIILPHTARENAWKLADKLRRKVAARGARLGAKMVPVTVSMGVAGFVPGMATTPAGLVTLADQALYAAKREGRNRVSLALTREEEREAARDSGLMAG